MKGFFFLGADIILITKNDHQGHLTAQQLNQSIFAFLWVYGINLLHLNFLEAIASKSIPLEETTLEMNFFSGK